MLHLHVSQRNTSFDFHHLLKTFFFDWNCSTLWLSCSIAQVTGTHTYLQTNVCHGTLSSYLFEDFCDN